MRKKSNSRITNRETKIRGENIQMREINFREEDLNKKVDLKYFRNNFISNFDFASDLYRYIICVFFH